MPFYEYQCKSCRHELEAMQKVMDPPLKKCPKCGRSQLQRLMSAPVFRLKGGGWYETDFKGDQDNRRNLADRPDDAPKEASADGAKDAPKDGATAAAADGQGKEGQGKEGQGKEVQGKEGQGKEGQGKEGATEAARAKGTPKDKGADKASVKSAQPAKKPAAPSSSRGRTVSHGKAAAKRPIKRAVHKAKRRV